MSSDSDDSQAEFAAALEELFRAVRRATGRGVPGGDTELTLSQYNVLSALGERIATYLGTGDSGVLPLPIRPIRPIPFHRFRRIGVAATIAWYRMLDSLER